MRKSIIVAFDRKGLIGSGNSLPWRIPEDLKRFKNLTSGHVVIMGRKTRESIGRFLPNRTNIVVSRQAGYQAEGCLMANSIEGALALAENAQEVFFIGGVEVYREALKIADRMYITYINQEFSGNVYFPEFKKDEWKEISKEHLGFQDKNPYDLTFLVLEKLKVA